MQDAIGRDCWFQLGSAEFDHADPDGIVLLIREI